MAVDIWNMPVHPAAALLPMMSDEEIAALMQDIQEHGLLNPILTYRGEIIDGCNRRRACKMGGVEPRVQEYVGDDPIGTIASLSNNRRKSLSGSQRVLIAAGFMDHFQKQAAARREAGLKRGVDAPVTANWRQREIDAKGASAEHAARTWGVSQRGVERALRAQATGVQELLDAVRYGLVPISAAEVVATLPADEQREILEKGEVSDAAKRIRARRKPVPPKRAAKAIAKKCNALLNELLAACERADVRKELVPTLARLSFDLRTLTETPDAEDAA